MADILCLMEAGGSVERESRADREARGGDFLTEYILQDVNEIHCLFIFSESTEIHRNMSDGIFFMVGLGRLLTDHFHIVTSYLEPQVQELCFIFGQRALLRRPPVRDVTVNLR